MKQTKECKMIIEFGKEFRKNWGKYTHSKSVLPKYKKELMLEWFLPDELYTKYTKHTEHYTISVGDNCGDSESHLVSKTYITPEGYARKHEKWNEEYSNENAVIIRATGLAEARLLKIFEKQDLEARAKQLIELYGIEYTRDVIENPKKLLDDWLVTGNYPLAKEYFFPKIRNEYYPLMKNYNFPTIKID